MGRQGYAYYDKDSARYQYTPGVNTEGNKGYAYRNDGVDVQKKDGSPYIFSIEDGEWMQYTIDVQEAGKYNVSFVAASEKEGSFISININDELNIANIPIAATGGTNKWGLSKKENIRLKKGINHFTYSVAWQTTSKDQITSDGWSFLKNDSSAHSTNWEQVTIPHTWNIEDVMDDVPGYYRGVGVYKRQLQIDNTLNGKQLFLFFEGVNQVAEIFVNGKKAGNHVGGYAAFSVDITPFIKPGNGNEIIVKVDNRYNADIPPLSADFSFFGGIYRDVLLIAVETVHFSLNDFGSKGVFIITPSVTRSSASVVVKTTLTNKLHDKQKIKIVSSVTNKKGKKVGAAFSVQTVEQGADQSFSNTVIKIKDPHLWSPESPYLYTVTTEIRDAVSNRLLDIIKNPLGLRWFRFDSKNGFFLNDKPYKLIGSSRHQDYKGMGNAVPKKFATRDVELIKEMGGNFLRVAHYPQDPAILEACDRLGILASVEIPIVNEITESESFYNNCEDMQVEMIRQHFNHPSVIMWCYMNEVLLKPHFNNNKEKQKIYYANIARLAKRLDSITRKEDPFRYTMMAHHGDFIRYKEVGLIDIPMLVGWNLYSGWYGGDMSGFPAFLDQFHKAYPDKPMMVTEYGADADPRIWSNERVRFDKSVEYFTNII